mmetsp:Transcript_16220/g.35299  ORF Transcript_16220/g.35299 Transcript_16220/m.35299 type:complete len:234 (-) Transcript_16220:157-858(-)
MDCNECADISDCNYHGKCTKQHCICYDDYFGNQCQFDYPCDALSSKIGAGCDTMSLLAMKGKFVRVYDRPLYVKHNLSEGLDFLLGNQADLNPDDDFLKGYLADLIPAKNNTRFDSKEMKGVLSDRTVVILHSGSRWLGSVMLHSEAIRFKRDLSEYHGFWEKAFDRGNTFLISDVSYEGTPDNVDFFRMYQQKQVERHTGLGAYGVLAPLVDLEGVGFFSCVSEDGYDCNDV